MTKERLYTRNFALVQFTSFLYFFSYGATLPVLPLLVRDRLGLGDFAVGVAGAAYAVTSVFARPMAGRLGDRAGRKILVTGGSAIVGVCTIATIAAEPIARPLTGMWALAFIVSIRLLLGIGEGAEFTGAATMINDMAPEARRGEAVSLFTLSLYGGLALGPVAGEAVLGAGRFNAAWMFAGAVALLAALLGTRVRETRPQSQPVESKHRLFHGAAIAPGIVMATSTWAFAGFSAFLPLYARSIGMDGSGLVYFVYSSVIAVIRLLGSRIPDMLGPKLSATMSLAGSSAGLATIAAWREPTGLFTGAILFALGQSLAFPALLTIAVRGAPASERGSVVGTFTSFVDIGFGLGPLTLGAVAAAMGYPAVFAGGAISAGVGFLILQSQRERRAVVQESEALQRIEPPA